MRLRESLLLFGLVTAFAVAGVVVLSSDDDRPGPSTEENGPPEVSTPTARDPGSTPEVPTAVVTSDSQPPEARATVTDAPRPDGPGYGVLDGRVLIAADAAGRATQYTILVEEMINPNAASEGRPPTRLTRGFKAEPNESPLYFAFDEVPFSAFGYRVTVFVPGLNGSSQVVRVTENEWNPEVVLALTGGAPFSLRLIDQLRNPHAELAVSMWPTGMPTGRPTLRGNTNNFGTAVFDEVLAGDYEVRLVDRVVGTVTVAAPGFVRDEAGVGAQSALLTVPHGRTVRVEVFDDAGYGLPDATVVLFAIDTVENRRFNATTDVTGIVEFEFVAPGRYQLDVRARGRQPTSRTVEVGQDQNPTPQQIRLPLL